MTAVVLREQRIDHTKPVGETVRPADELREREIEAGVCCSVLVPVLNEERHIAASVAAMGRQRFPGRLEFLLVDGGSTDGTREILDRLAQDDERIRILDNPRQDTPSALNLALQHARGRWVARMDAHTRYPDDYLICGVERLKRGDTRWVSGPPIPKGERTVSRAVSLALTTPLGRGASRKWSTRCDREFELDAGVFVGVWERATLFEYGGWDERWPRNQDSEMAGRFLARGERLVCIPAMAAEYTPRGSLVSLWRQYLQYGEYRFKTAARHPHTLRRSHLIAPSLVFTVAASLGAPRRFRPMARAGVLTYSVMLLAAGIRASRHADRLGDAALVPIVLAVMHLAHGAGAYRSALRHGVPMAALARMLGFDRVAARLAPPTEDVFAPSLGDLASLR